jgi:hypothetical protein
MATDLEKIKRTLVGISRGNSILDTLIEFERTLDNVEIFAYKNWISGELVEGPTISRYWYKTVWMFPYNLMPDPDAGLRLTKLGSRVSFKKAIFKRPVKVKGPEDWVDPESKRAKMKETDIWLVTIKLPIKYINRGLDTIDDTIQQDIQKTNADIEMAFDEQEPAEMPTEDVIDGEEEIPLEDEQI